jgi:hypothetical protein
MKKQLLATTALVGASLMVAGNAWAQASPIQMGVKGYWREMLNFVTDPSRSDSVLAPAVGTGVTTYTGTTGTANTKGKVRTYQNELESRTFFTGEGKLDNGITPGVMIQFESFTRQAIYNNAGSTGNTVSATNGITIGNQERRASAYFKGAFGELRMGNIDNIQRLNATYAALINQLGADSPSGAYPLGTNNTYPDPATGASRILYLSPKFAGFDFGFSYAPDASSDFQDSGAVTFTKDGIGSSRSRGAWSENWTVLGRYLGPIGPVNVGADIGYTGSSNECKGRTTAGAPNFAGGCVGADSDVTTVVGHGFVKYAGFQIGMGYAQLNNWNGNSLDRTIWSPGIDYTTGPWTFGFYYSTGEYDMLRSPLSGTGAALGPAVKSTDKLDVYALAAQYVLGPGITLQGQVGYQKYNYGVNASYRNAADFGFTPISSQDSWNFIMGAFFAY